MRPLIVAPCVTRQNRYSFAALFGSLIRPSGSGSRVPLPEVIPWTSIGQLGEAAGSMDRRSSLLVAFSFSTPEMPTVAPLIEKVRRLGRSRPAPRIVRLAGGPHPSGDPESVLALGVDACVVGPGERPFREILRATAAGSSLQDIRGLVTRPGQTVEAARDVDLDGYQPFYPPARLFAPLEITRGCPQGCRFCQTGYLFGGRLRHRSPDAVVRWLHDLLARGHRSARFISPNAFAYGSDRFDQVSLEALERVLSLAAGRMGRDNLYYGGFPSEVWPTSVTRETVRLVRRFAANRRLVVGAQSGSQAVLDRIRRRHTTGDVARAVEVIRDGGLQADVDFILGLPEETDEDRRETLAFMREIIKLGARVHAHSFLPLAGTPLYHAEPSPIDPDTRLALERLSGEGRLFGQWRAQEALARQLRAFLERLREARASTARPDDDSP